MNIMYHIHNSPYIKNSAPVEYSRECYVPIPQRRQISVSRHYLLFHRRRIFNIRTITDTVHYVYRDRSCFGKILMEHFLEGSAL